MFQLFSDFDGGFIPVEMAKLWNALLVEGVLDFFLLMNKAGSPELLYKEMPGNFSSWLR